MAGKYQTADRVVVKIGTGTLFDADAGASSGYKFLGDQMDGLCFDIATISKEKEIVVVSSGAIASAACKYEQPIPKGQFERAQMAGRGQPLLMRSYIENLSRYGKECAQCLLTRDDIADRKRGRNLRRVLEGYLDGGIVPIVNENDTVAIEEITFGDNDILAAMLAGHLDADLVIMLSNTVDMLGTGGGSSKNQAHKMLESEGIPLEILSGRYEKNWEGLWKLKIRLLF